MSALIVAAVVREGRIHICDDFYRTRAAKSAKSWGDGVELQIRIEPVDEAVALNQYRHLFGHVFEPVADYTGHTKVELCLMAKAQFMPDDGRTSLTQLNHEEMAVFIQHCEEWLRVECPDAFILYERQGAA